MIITKFQPPLSFQQPHLFETQSEDHTFRNVINTFVQMSLKCYQVSCGSDKGYTHRNGTIKDEDIGQKSLRLD